MPRAQNVARRWTEFQFGQRASDKQVFVPAELLVDDRITTWRTGEIVLFYEKVKPGSARALLFKSSRQYDEIGDKAVACIQM